MSQGPVPNRPMARSIEVEPDDSTRSVVNGTEHGAGTGRPQALTEVLIR